MKVKRIGLFIFIMMLAAVVMVGCSEDSSGSTNESNSESENNSESNSDSEDSGSSGGELRVALNAQPATIDPVMSTAVATKNTARLMFETLLAPNSNYEPVPMLAESVDLSDDGKTYTFNLRQGIKFHNGEEMTAEDVVASMNRWLEKSTLVGEVFGDSEFEVEDEYTVLLKLDQPSSLVLNIMASAKQFAGIMPKEIVEAADSKGVKEFIGTGPFKFVEWKQDQYIHFEKYEDYQPVDGTPDGLTGKKEPLVDDIYFDIVSDPSTRLAGLQTGKYDIIFELPHDNYEQMNADPKVETYTNHYGNLVLIYNKIESVMSDPQMRKAINTALDNDKIMLGAVNNDELYSISSGYMPDDNVNWATDAGSEFYNQKDPEKAMTLAEEAGYNGEKIRLMATRDYHYMYNAAVVVTEQLKKAGFNVELEIYDWPTLLTRRDDASKWEMFITSASTVSVPSQLLQISPVYAGGKPNETIAETLRAIETASSQEEASELWVELQEYAWKEYVPVTKFGDFSNIFGTTDEVEGFSTFSGPIFWNTKITE
jgi:peptide/nickel transport system substrate-binding protein